MRHYEVNFIWKDKYASEEFKVACKNYDCADVINQKPDFDINLVQQIYISELSRSEYTYIHLKLNLTATKSDLINEVPIAPFITTTIKLPTAIWLLMGRVQWYLNSKRQPETRNDTIEKIKRLITELETKNKNTLIIGHGFYFSQLKRILKKLNYRGSGKSYYKNGEVIKFSKL